MKTLKHNGDEVEEEPNSQDRRGGEMLRTGGEAP